MVASLGAARADLPDANKDGVPDVENILNRIDVLANVGVKFDDEDVQGHLPMRRKDGKYHMACIDLPLVVYRAAGYDIAGAMVGGPLFNTAAKPESIKSGRFRQIVYVVDWMKKQKDFNFYQTPEAGNLALNKSWRPAVPFRLGDMVFVHYDDASDKHSGIVTGVDPATGLPTHITQVSIYNENQGMHRSTLEEFFSLKCRVLTGYARPATWDGGRPVPQALAAPLPPKKLKKKPSSHRGGARATAAAHAAR